MLDGDDVVFVARSSPARMFSGGLEIGYRLPAFCTSVGRAMLGQLDDADARRAPEDNEARDVDAADGDRSQGAAGRITADREQGYSLVDREAEPHFRSISVPVRRYDSVIVAAINMGAHVDRVPAGIVDVSCHCCARARSVRSQL